MKKIILAVMATSMLLTNVAFASTNANHIKNTKNNIVSSVNKNNVFHVDSVDPH
ncbi:hypothetical protein CDLVIII_5686 [Clostridium sp. DL-VIII]|uniref:hypothetical protein n=1 Tax=Clostridium sp. DL-VIII TaxID=641107 RepID=UPI00023B0798|nr:hypothetical protein [Clostridium sp. DL-VIII]EHJ02156.1 hypothetical protein CDLVIII_5686 [Clostridium sp. DL-VIII]